jgi:hypothetical protein
MTRPAPLSHDTTARTARAALILLLVWLAILTLWLALEAAPFIVALLLLATLPAAWDFASGRRAWLRLDDRWLRWGSGRAEGEIALDKIEKVRFETRLDLSVRVRIVIDTGKRYSLPQDAVPSREVLEAAFEARGIATERHHFVLFGT